MLLAGLVLLRKKQTEAAFLLSLSQHLAVPCLSKSKQSCYLPERASLALTWLQFSFITGRGAQPVLQSMDQLTTLPHGWQWDLSPKEVIAIKEVWCKGVNSASHLPSLLRQMQPRFCAWGPALPWRGSSGMEHSISMHGCAMNMKIDH